MGIILAAYYAATCTPLCEKLDSYASGHTKNNHKICRSYEGEQTLETDSEFKSR